MTTLAEDALIAKALPLLKLRDIMLHSSRFMRPSSAPIGDVQAQQLTNRRVKFVVGDAPVSKDSAPGGRLLQVFVDLGLFVTQTGGNDEKVYFQIEAGFLVEYSMLGDISDESIKAFSNFNSVHNVWPFWRQHVFDIVSRGRLPRLDIPLFGGRRRANAQDVEAPALAPASRNRSTRSRAPRSKG